MCMCVCVCLLFWLHDSPPAADHRHTCLLSTHQSPQLIWLSHYTNARSSLYIVRPLRQVSSKAYSAKYLFCKCFFWPCVLSLSSALPEELSCAGDHSSCHCLDSCQPASPANFTSPVFNSSTMSVLHLGARPLTSYLLCDLGDPRDSRSDGSPRLSSYANYHYILVPLPTEPSARIHGSTAWPAQPSSTLAGQNQLTSSPLGAPQSTRPGRVHGAATNYAGSSVFPCRSVQ
ncbi:uncharacterized protein LOC122869276 [Siniperca chuatsi]|uniref:uncharacterized protein LOC122869276 n=1 Tax=Siniperca chuatsi TaxID=119488 RepID=UPI001CE046FD|nr:uncharacterized protein LOC122869276 [Siniperca chuatsi]